MKTKSKTLSRNELINFLTKYAIIILMLILMLVVGCLKPSFFSFSNFRNILNQIAVVGILACAMTFVLLIGCIDLSVGAIMSVTGVIAVMMCNQYGTIPALLVPPLLGALIGLGNGVLIAVTKGRMGESFMITYGMQTAMAAVALLITRGLYVQFKEIGSFVKIGKGLNPIYILIVILAICQFFLNSTGSGRKMLYIGENPAAAKLSGINVGRYVVSIFVVCGLIVGIAGIVLPARVVAANPAAGSGYEMDAIAACVVGGVRMGGGKGTFYNTLLGVLIMGVLQNALNLLGVMSNPQYIVKGIVIIFAVTMDILGKHIKERRA